MVEHEVKRVGGEGLGLPEWRCCVCWLGPPIGKAKAHLQSACPWLRAFNSAREKEGLAPIKFTQEGFDVTPEKEPLKLEKVAKDLGTFAKESRGQISALDKRTTTLEKHTGLKRKAEDQSAGNADAPKKKKKKSKKSTQPNDRGEGSSSGPKPSGSGQQQQQSQAQPGGKKGKGKAKEQA